MPGPDNFVKIEELSAGDAVLSCRFDRCDQRQIQTIRQKEVDQIVEIDLGQEVIRAAPGQLFFLPQQTKWVRAIDLENGQSLQTRLGEEVGIRGINLSSEVTRVYYLSMKKPAPDIKMGLAAGESVALDFGTEHRIIPVENLRKGDPVIWCDYFGRCQPHKVLETWEKEVNSFTELSGRAKGIFTTLQEETNLLLRQQKIAELTTIEERRNQALENQGPERKNLLDDIKIHEEEIDFAYAEKKSYEDKLNIIGNVFSWDRSSNIRMLEITKNDLSRHLRGRDQAIDRLNTLNEGIRSQFDNSISNLRQEIESLTPSEHQEAIVKVANDHQFLAKNHKLVTASNLMSGDVVYIGQHLFIINDVSNNTAPLKIHYFSINRPASSHTATVAMPAERRITTQEAGEIDVQALRKGDRISYCLSPEKCLFRTVADVWQRVTNDLLAIQFRNLSNGEVCTAHRDARSQYLANGVLTEAKDLTVGDKIYDLSRGFVAVESVVAKTEEVSTLYYVSVENPPLLIRRFTEGTSFRLGTKAKNYVAVERLTKGQEIVSCVSTTCRARRVVDVWRGEVDKVTKVRAGELTFHTVPEHQFYLPDEDTLVEAKHLDGKRVLISNEETSVPAQQIGDLNSATPVYYVALENDDDQYDLLNFYVSEQEVLAHNFVFMLCFTYIIGEGLIWGIGALAAGALIATVAINSPSPRDHYSSPYPYVHYSGPGLAGPSLLQISTTVAAPKANLMAAEAIAQQAPKNWIPSLRELPKVMERNRLQPDIRAEGPHSTFRPNPKTGRIDKYQTNEPNLNPLDPSKWRTVKRFDRTGKSHRNKVTKKDISTPHVHDPKIPGGIRPAQPCEIPK